MSRPVHRAPRRAAGPAWTAVLLGLIAGIIAMHGFSVGHHVVTDPTVTDAAGAATHASGDVQPDPPVVDACPAGSCDDAGAMGAMCLFVLVSLVLTLRGRGRAVWHPHPTWPTALHLPVDDVPPGVRSGELLTRLCISRT